MLEAFDRDQLVLIVLEFLEAVLHQLLFVRRLYSPEVFERQKLYGVAVRKARHPELNKYLHEVVSSLQVPVADGSLDRLVVVISDSARTPIERHVIQPEVLAPEEPQPLDVDALHSQLRSVLVKLQYADSYLAPLPAGCTFEVLAYTYGRRAVDRHTWVEEQPVPGEVLELGEAEIVPIKSCLLEDALQLQLFVESKQRRR